MSRLTWAGHEERIGNDKLAKRADAQKVDGKRFFYYDIAMLVLFGDFVSYKSYLSSVVRFSSCCSIKFMHLNVSKTKCASTSVVIELSLVLL